MIVLRERPWALQKDKLGGKKSLPPSLEIHEARQMLPRFVYIHGTPD